jgi:4-alpha-glucanotransferase
VGVLRSLGAPLDTAWDAPAALRERRLALARRVCEPVLVAWDGRPPAVRVRTPASAAGRRLRLRLVIEGGDSLTFDLRGDGNASFEEVDGARFVSRALRLPSPLPLGYHRLSIEGGGKLAEAVVIAAPRRAPGDPEATDWGVFLPLYALRRRRSWGTGDLTDLEALMAWVGGLGGGVVATLPLLAAFLDQFYEPSPYSPASRLFWNELYVDPTRLPELERSAEARELIHSERLARDLRAIRRGNLVDYPRAMAAKRAVLELLASCLFESGGPRIAALRTYVREHPSLREYARFRATCERRREPWSAWPALLRSGTLRPADADADGERYHLYAQWVAEEQMASVGRAAREAGVALYLDMPLSVNPAGFDVWRDQAIFALSAHGGAPPDEFFTRGQDWGFPPLHPERIRDQHLAYPISVIRHVARHAGVLRIDHVMGLHRMFWIPPGMDATGGVYVRYRAEELFAVLTLEAYRHDVRVVGEDLGTVPGAVRRAMARHNVHRSYVGQFSFRPHPREAIEAPSPAMFASLNTHDLPPFAAFWAGRDIDDRRGMGLIEDDQARAEHLERAATRRALVAYLRRTRPIPPSRGGVPNREIHGDDLGREVLRGCLSFLASGAARVVVVNLEDLWWETDPQNVPGTGSERPNWRRRARHTFEEFRTMPEVVDALREIDRLRARSGGR